MSTLVGARLVGARLALPGDWTDLDLDPATRHRSISRAVRQAVARDPGLADDSVRLLGLLDDISRRAWESGAFFCSSLVLSSDDAGLLAANVLLQVCDAPAEAEVPRGELCSALALAIACDPDWEGADISVVALPEVGPAVRAEVVSGGVCVQYVAPLPHGNESLVVTFSSPSAPFSNALIALFDSIAASITLDFAETSADDGPEAVTAAAAARRAFT